MRKAITLSVSGILLLSACADVATMTKARDERAGFAAVSDISRRATGAEAAWLQSPAELQANAQRVHGMVHRKTLSADQAVQIALLNNRGENGGAKFDHGSGGMMRLRAA